MHEDQYQQIRDFLKRFIWRCRAVGVMEAVCYLGAGLAVVFGLGLAVDLLKGPLPYAPLVYSVLTAATLLVLLGAVLFRFFQPKKLEWAARIIEQRRPELRNNLINSLQLYPRLARPEDGDQSSAAMIRALVRQTQGQLATLAVPDLVHTARLKAWTRTLVVLAVPVVAVIAWQPSLLDRTMGLVAHPLRHLPPADIFIDVVTKDVRVIRGTGVTIEAITSGAQPDEVELALRPAGPGEAETDPQRIERIEMQRFSEGENRYRGQVSRVGADLEYRVAADSFTSPWYRIAAVERPAVADLKVMLYPPHYTGLPAETIVGGNIRGIKGSTLSFDVETNKDAARAKLVLDSKREIPLKVTGKNAQGSMVLFRSQRYSIRIEDEFGFVNLAIPYEMRALPDAFPTVELLQPTDDLEVNGDESLALEYHGSDDYGVQEIRLVARVGEREERVPMWEDEPARNLRDRFSWDLSALGLKEGDVVTYHLEVLDNDTISGPKLGKSRPLTLRLKNIKAEHEKVADMLRQLSDEMVDLLGDHLEAGEPLESAEAETPVAETTPPGMEQQARREQPLAQGLDRMMSRVDELMEQIRTDKMSDFATWSDLEQLKRNLDYTRTDLIERMNQASSPEQREAAHDEMATELERMSMLSEDIGKRLTGQNIASTAQDMLKSQERLLDSLEKLRSGNKELDEVLKELSELSRQLQELQNSLAQFAQQAPDQFLNRESMRNMPFSDMQSAMQEIRKKLEQGDIEGALQMARELFNQMAQMVASLRGNQQQAQNSMMGRMQSAMMQSSSELQQILEEQQSILQGTETSHKETTRILDEKLAEALAQFEEKARAQLPSMVEAFQETLEETRENASPAPGTSPEGWVQPPSYYPLFAGMSGMLDERDFTALKKQMELALDELKKEGLDTFDEDQKRAIAALEELAEQQQALSELTGPELTAEQKETVRGLAGRESALEHRTGSLTERLRNLFQLFPSLDPKILKNIEEAEGFMGTAAEQLAALEPGTAIPPEEQAIQRLSQSNQQMQSAMQQLAQRGQMGRVPLVYMFRLGRFMPSGRLMPLPGTPQFPDFDVDQGITGLDTEKFKLPGKDDYQPEKFREEILDSLKQGVPPQFKEQIESYFKELTQ